MNFLSAIILAAGRAERMGGALNKTLLPLAGRPVLAHVLAMWQPWADSIIVAARPEDWPPITELIAPYHGAARLVQGGANRADSLARALAALPPCAEAARELIAVHDAARPLTAPGDIKRVIDAAQEQGAAILAAPVTDTIRYQDGQLCGGLIPRGQLLAAQTPQIFRRDWLTTAYAEAGAEELAGITDDAALLQARGHQCAYVWAESVNFKLTRPEDMVMAEAILCALA